MNSFKSFCGDSNKKEMYWKVTQTYTHNVQYTDIAFQISTN
jgi:hypothetical protein